MTMLHPENLPTRRSRVIGGNWWRFSRYEIRDGRICAPEKGEPKPYDPWSQYYASRSERGTNEPPYQGLMRLIRDLSLKPATNGRRYSLDRSGERQVLDWCAENGLLGILPFRVCSVTLHPRWWRPLTQEELRKERVPEEYVGGGQPPEGYLPRGALVASQVRYITSTAMWWERILKIDRSRPVVPGRDQPAGLGDLVPAELVPSYWPTPGAVLRDLRGRDVREEPLSRTFTRFFIGVPPEETETYLYPRPGTMEFARQYCEPLDDFLEAAFVLRDVADTLLLKTPIKDMTKPEMDRLFSAKMTLEALVAPVSRGFRIAADETYEDYLASPSLFSSFAMMLFDDLIGQRLFRCPSCGLVFASSAYQAEYCSDTCRRREYKRRWRAGGGGKTKQKRRGKSRRSARGIGHGKARS